MKKVIIGGVIVFVAALLAAPAAVQAQFSYTTNADGITLTITGYSGAGGDVTIPATNNTGLPVTSIGDWAFYSTGVINVTISDTVTNIGDGAFFDCESLTNVTIGDNIASIGDWAFGFCSSLTNVNFRGNAPGLGGVNVFYGDSATVNYLPGTAGWGPAFGGLAAMLWNPPVPYSYTTNNGTITITRYTGPGGLVAVPTTINFLPVTSIGVEAFMYCFGLTSVTIPGSVISIGDTAFGFCTNLTNATIANGVANIGANGFYNCGTLASVNIQGSVTNIGAEAFWGCPSLTAITVEAQNSFYSSVNGVLFDKSQTTLIQCPGELGGSFTIPASVISIEDDAFFGCTRLTNVTIPGSVTYIGLWAFAYCTNLTSLVIPASVTNIEGEAFYQCLSLRSVYFEGDECLSLVGLGLPFLPWETAYYLPGTTGWNSVLIGCPVVLWNPLIQTADGSFGVQNGQFGFNITGTTNIPIVVEACSDLASPVWIPLLSLTLTNGSYYFSEPLLPGSSGRYYRIGSQ